MGQHRNAIDKYSQAISMNSGFAESYLGRGLSYRNLDEYDNAVSDLKTYLSKTGAHDGYVALADVYFKMGKNKEAYAIASQGIAKYGNSGILKVLANNILKNKID
jgi:tetratricopeptide repeat family protein